MSLNEAQIERVRHIWKTYVENGEKFINASKEFTNQELDQKRREIIPEVIDWLNRFLTGEVALEEFKTVNDGINKRNRLWGFQAINGQMFFNMLTKTSVSKDRREEFINLLKKSLPAPSTISEAKSIIENFTRFTRELGQYISDARAAPKVGSIPYFLSYFWQIQQPEKYPVYYTSMVNVLSKEDIWIPTGEVSEDYRAFYELNHMILPLLSKETGKQLHLWDIEHAFWFHGQIPIPMDDSQVINSSTAIESVAVKDEIIRKVTVRQEELSENYIPPIVAILPRLAMNDVDLAETYRSSGRAIEKIFEERLAIIFRMLGFETQLLGQGQGRVPDGVAVSQEFRYAIIYDAKVRQNAYTMGTDERAIREYIAVQGERLRKQGMRSLYFMVISSTFTGDHDDAIRTLKIDTNVNEVLLVEVKSLLAMLEGKLRNPNVSLGPDGIQRLLASSGLLTEVDVREFLEI
jgi:hypothetical protein